MIPRVHLFELEDQDWFPNLIRDLATDFLEFMEARMALHASRSESSRSRSGRSRL